jgi:hypothetical protein
VIARWAVSPDDPRVLPTGTFSPELAEVLRFIDEQNKNQREYFSMLYKWTAGSVTILFVVIGIAVTLFGLRSLAEIREQMASVTKNEIEHMRSEVSQRVNAEFQTEAIQRTVKDAARSQTTTAIKPLISSEVSQQVKLRVGAAESTIVSTVKDETQKAVKGLSPGIDKAVSKAVDDKVGTAVQSKIQNEIQPVLSSLRDSAELTSLSTRASSGDAAAYDRLLSLVSTSNDAGTRQLADVYVNKIIDENNSGMYMTRGFQNPITEDQKAQVLHYPDAGSRQAALDTLDLPHIKDNLRTVFTLMMKDSSLKVRAAAFRRFVEATSAKIRVLDLEAAQQYWEAHASEYPNAR